jgi:hypothetical protein
MSKLDEIKKDYEPQKETIKSLSSKQEIDVDEIKKHLDDTIKERTSSKPVTKNEQTIFAPKDRKELVDKTLLKFRNKKIKLKRREKNMVENMEYDSIKNTQGIVIGLAIIGIIFIMLVREFLPSEALYVIIILIGSFMFIPVGMIMGWVAFDSTMRCKVLRKVSKRNYGIVNFVGRGRRIVSKIKNFDYGLIWQEDGCWVLTKDKIFQLTKDGNVANEGKVLDPDSVLTLVDTVPVIFVDMDSMEPLSIMQSGRVPVYPSEIGANCKAWVDIQRAKLLKGKKAMDILLIVVIICSIGAIAVSVLTMNKVDELTKMVQMLQNNLLPPP